MLHGLPSNRRTALCELEKASRQFPEDNEGLGIAIEDALMESHVHLEKMGGGRPDVVVDKAGFRNAMPPTTTTTTMMTATATPLLFPLLTLAPYPLHHHHHHTPSHTPSPRPPITSAGFYEVKEVTNDITCIPDLLVWGGVGTRMDIQVETYLQNWTDLIRSRGVSFTGKR